MARESAGRRVTLHVVAAPAAQRVELQKAARGIPLHVPDVRARSGLAAAQPGDPGVDALERQVERLYLAQSAAPIRRALPEPRALTHLLLSDAVAGLNSLYGDSEVILDALEVRIRLVKMKPGVQEEHAQRQAKARRVVEDNDAGVPESGRKSEPVVEDLAGPLKQGANAVGTRGTLIEASSLN